MFSGGAAGAEPLVSLLAEMFVGVAQPSDIQPHLMLSLDFQVRVFVFPSVHPALHKDRRSVFIAVP